MSTYENVGLCLSGGGAKGAYEVGVLEYIAEHPELFPNGFMGGSGTSVGAVNLGGVVQFAPGPQQVPHAVDYMVRCWERLGNTEDVWTKRFPPYLAGLWNPSIGINTPLRKLLTEFIDFDRVKVGTPCEVAAWDLLSGRALYFALHEAKTLEELVSFILASSSFPLAFPPEWVGGAYCTDGGIADIAPTKRLIRMGCDHILAIVCRNPKQPDAKKITDLGTVLAVGSRCLDGMESEIVRGDLEKVHLWNLLVESGHPAAHGKRKVGLDVILPEEPLGDPLDFSPALTTKRRKAGYSSAKHYFEDSARKVP
jgi:NTE family protein